MIINEEDFNADVNDDEEMNDVDVVDCIDGNELGNDGNDGNEGNDGNKVDDDDDEDDEDKEVENICMTLKISLFLEERRGTSEGCMRREGSWKVISAGENSRGEH